MKSSNSAESAASLKALRRCGLLNGHEIEVVNRLGEPIRRSTKRSPWRKRFICTSKVSDTHQLPINQFFDAGARLDHPERRDS